jgi:hypothetical protein
MSAGYPQSLCHACRWMREIISGRGSRFVLCEKALVDERFAKYPPQPIGRCSGYEAALRPVNPPAEGHGNAQRDQADTE